MFKHGADMVDQAVQDLLETRLGSALSHEGRAQTMLPLSKSGLGFTSIADRSSAAYLASTAMSSKFATDNKLEISKEEIRLAKENLLELAEPSVVETHIPDNLQESYSKG